MSKGNEPEAKTSPHIVKEEKKILKVVVLSEPYFPKQKLSIRFSSLILQHMEIEEGPPGDSGIAGTPTPGQNFGIVAKYSKNNKTHAAYGTMCEIQGQESSNLVFNGGQVTSGFSQVRAVGVVRFKIHRVLHRALDGLILTCDVTCFYEEGCDEDTRLAETPLFEQLSVDSMEMCRLSQKTFTTSKQHLYAQKEAQIKQMTKSASELTYFVCQLLTIPTKQDLQTILEENDINQRM